MITTRSTTTLARRVRARWLVRATFVAAALVLGVGALIHPTTARAQYDHDFYNFCIKDLGQSIEYCCLHAGGVMRDGKCGDPG